MFKHCCLLWSSVVYLSSVIYAKECEGKEIPLKSADKRPIWNIAHMVNSISEVTEFLDKGANAIEFDVTFDSDFQVDETFQKDGECGGDGRPCDKKEDFRTYLEFIRETTTPGYSKYRKELVLLYMDCRITKLDDAGQIAAGESLAKEIVETYWQNGTTEARAYILISVPDVWDIELVTSFVNTLSKFEKFEDYKKKIGFDISGNYASLKDTGSVFQSANLTENLWQGEGTETSKETDFSLLKEAIQERDIPGGSNMKKVYFWNVNEARIAQIVLALGVDAIITNYPEKVNEAMDRIKKFPGNPPMFIRLATSDDNPWERFVPEKTLLRKRGKLLKQNRRKKKRLLAWVLACIRNHSQ